MKILRLKVFFWGLLLNSFLSLSVRAQESEGGTPPSFALSKDYRAKLSIPTYTTGAIPMEKLQAEDVVMDKGKFPYRFGYNFNVSIDIKKEGTSQLLDDGSTLWTYRVTCPGALSINFLYSAYHLPEGAKLFIYNQDKSFILGAYTKRNNQDTKKFGTETVPGEVVTLEYLEPAHVEFPGEVVLGVIVHGYRTHASSNPQAQEAGSCNVNINCPEAAGWENQKRAVARIIMNGNTLCTGTLINNARQDDTPYFLTANHCIGDLDAVSKPDASGWVFYWNYESATCSGTSGPETQTTAGGTIMANYNLSDFALVKLKSKPSTAYNVFYAGWNRGTAASNGAVGIHHPAGDIKKFSKDNSTLEDDNGTHWRVPSWDIGVTEGGSSGSSIFDFNKRIIGQLTGGASACGNSALWDVYGKLSFSWDQGASAQRRLKDWLDPDNLGATILDGKNAGAVGNNAPTVTITSPANNTSYSAPALVTITANASDTDGAVSKVEFFNGSAKLGEDLTSPYSFAWSNVAAGMYILTAKATDNNNATTTSSSVTIVVNTPANIPPTVSIVAPLNNSVFTAPASVIINANANDADGSVTRVEFFNGSTKIGQDTTTPYAFTWSNVAAGTYVLTAIAMDNNNASTTSTSVTIVVNPPSNTLPTVSITAPTNNTSYTAPASLTITANAADADGSVSKIEFFNGSTKLGEDLTSPYSFTWTNVAAGTYIITAKATDNSNATTTSSSITILVNAPINTPPTANITSPANNSSYTAPASITITANATDADGVIAKVEFFNGSTKLGEDVSAPYTFTWSDVAAGTYALTVKATDNVGATGTSSVVTIVVNAVTDLCAYIPQYVENNGFQPGSRVKNGGRIYECKPWPFSGWCNLASWAYGPGIGMYWTDAWIDAGSCSNAKSGSSNGAAPLSLQLSPNPSDNFITIDIENLNARNINVQLFDGMGQNVLTKDITYGTALDITSIQTGIYTLKVLADGELLMGRVVKR